MPITFFISEFIGISDLNVMLKGLEPKVALLYSDTSKFYTLGRDHLESKINSDFRKKT